MAYYSQTAGGSIRGRLGGGLKLVQRGRKVIIVEPPEEPGEIVTPLFQAQFANGDTVASWADQEMAFGESFAKGDVPPGNRIRAVIDEIPIPCQVSNRRFWSDGSLKVADIRVLIPPIPAGGTKTVIWQRVTGNWTAHDAPLHAAPSAVTSKVSLEYSFPTWKGRNASNILTEERGPKVFRSSEMLSPANSAWIDTVTTGPICSEWRASDLAVTGALVSEFTTEFNSDFAGAAATKDQNFGALLYVRAWGGTANNPKRIQFVYRTVQGWSTNTPADEQGIRVDINLRVNGTTVRGAAVGTPGWSAVNTWKGGFLVSCGTEGTMDWYDVATSSFITPPKVIYRRNIEYGIKTKFIPPFDVTNPAFPLTAGTTGYTPGRRGPLREKQDDVADHAMLGWTTSKPMAWIIAAYARGTPAQVLGHQRYTRAAALGMGAMTSIALHRTTRKIISYLPPSKQTNETALGASIYGTGKPAQAEIGLRWANGGTQAEISGLDPNHFPQMAFWPAYDFGEQFMLDLAYTEATLPGLFEDPAYGFYGTSSIAGVAVPYGGISYKGQIRGASHCGRPIGNALGLGNPADPHWQMVRDYAVHWIEMVKRAAVESDEWRGGLNRTDGRRFQDLKLLVPNNEPTYKIWMHTLGLGAMAYSYGISEHGSMKDAAEYFAHAPTVMAGGYHNDAGDEYYLMKPDAVEAVTYNQLAMDGMTSGRYPNTTGSPNSAVEYRRYWRFGQWREAVQSCIFKADGVTIEFPGAPYGATTMLNGMLITVSAPRGGEPMWVSNSAAMPPLGLTPGTVYYTVQSSGLTSKISLTRNGPPVTFATTNGVDQPGFLVRAAVGGVHPAKPGSAGIPGNANSYLVQIKSALDMVQHYVAPADPRILLARKNLATIKSTSTTPNEWDERGKTIVPLTLGESDLPDPGPWIQKGVGVLDNGTDDAVTLIGNGVGVLSAEREIEVEPGVPYTLTFTASKPISYTLEDL